MPFAFCQYQVSHFHWFFGQILIIYQFPEEAERAIREGRGRLIKGRPCRCEKAKAHRKLFLSHQNYKKTNFSKVSFLLSANMVLSSLQRRLLTCSVASANWTSSDQPTHSSSHS